MRVSYWTYYAVWILSAYLIRQPWLLVGVVAFVVLRRWIPDPGAIGRALRRASALRSQVDVNAANVPARRDLAVLYLDLLRPRKAIALLEQALARDPGSAELLYLHGLALHRAGRHENALAPLVQSVEADARVRFGGAYLAAGDSLLALGRNEEAIDAYERYTAVNGSDVGAYARLARAHANAGDSAAAGAAVREAIDTWRVLPGGLRRRYFGRFLGAQWARVWLLREPAAVALALLLAAATMVGARWAYPVLREALRPAPSRATGPGAAQRHALLDAFARCGSQTTGGFAGEYEPVGDPDEARSRALEGFEVLRDRITAGDDPVLELCLTRTFESTPQRLRAEAVWHEGADGRGDASLVELRLERAAETVRFTFYEPGSEPRWWVTLRRAE